MSLNTKVNGSWEASEDAYVKVGGQWKIAKSAWANIGGTWEQTHAVQVLDRFYRTLGGVGFNSTIYSVAVQSDGKILVGGQFSTLNGVTKNRLVRLNSDGTEDTAFYTNLGTGFNNLVYTMAVQSDGKILVGGLFTTLNGVSRNYLVRLNADGTDDTAFNTNLGTGFNQRLYSLAVQSDGKILVGGQFDTLNGVTRNRLVRLNTDGTVDTAFYANLGTGLSWTALALAVQSDGKILVGGFFSSINGVSRNYLVRLNADGTDDTAFYTNLGTGFNTGVWALAVQSDGKILVGGQFTTLNGVSRLRLVRLNSNGTEDTAFYTNLGTSFTSTLYTLAVQSDGKILVGGGFTTLNGVTRQYLVRLNSDGTDDTAFYTNLGGFNSTVYTVAVQSDGKIVVGGQFSTLNGASKGRLVGLNTDGTDSALAATNYVGFDNTIRSIAVQLDGKVLVGGQFSNLTGVTRNELVRLNSDGTEDTAFYANMGTGFNSAVYALAVQSDGKILVGGAFSTLNGATRNELVRLNADGTEDTAFYTNLGTGFNSTVWTLAVQSDGKILVGGQFSTLNGASKGCLVGLNTDGTEDTAFNNNLGTGFNSAVYTVAVQSDGKILVGGFFTGLNGVGRPYFAVLSSTGIDETPPNFSEGFGFGSGTEFAVAVQSDGKMLVGGSGTLNGVSKRLVRINTDGTEDTAFTANLGTGFNNYIRSIAVQSDGKILVAGRFTTLNGATRNYLVRLNSNGTEDTAFYANLGTGFGTYVYNIFVKVQSDGKILVFGDFYRLNGVVRPRLVRLNSNGTVETAFSTNLGTGFNNYIVYSVAVQSDGKIVVGGSFTRVNSVTRNRLLRLNSNGTVDTAFYTNLGTGLNSTVYSVAVQSDGKILVGGQFTTLNGVSRNRLLRLNSNGTVETAFSTNLGTGFSSTVQTLAVQSDGKILVGGQFITVNGVSSNRLGRLNSNGTLDTSFTTNLGTGFGNTVYALALQSDGKIVVVGSFTTLNDVPRNRLAKLNSDGTDAVLSTTNYFGFNYTIQSIAIQSDGKILVGGDFTSLNATVRGRLVRLNADLTEDTAFNNNLGTGFGYTVRSIAFQSDGKVLVGGQFSSLNGATRNELVRLNSDGTEDTAFYTYLGGFNSTVYAVAVRSDGKILVGGQFLYYNEGFFAPYFAALKPI